LITLYIRPSLPVRTWDEDIPIKLTLRVEGAA
jgi:hypothetical protein